MHIIHIPRYLLALALLAGSAAAAGQNAGAVGYVIVVKGEATARQPDGTTRTLARRSEIMVRDTLITIPDSSLQVMLDDNTQFVLRENSEFFIDDMGANNRTPGQHLIVTLMRGCVRFMSGTTGKNPYDDVRLDTLYASLNLIEQAVFEACIDDTKLETALSAGSVMVSNYQGNLRLDFTGQFDFAETLADQLPVGSRVQPVPPPPPPTVNGPVRLRPQDDFEIIPLKRDDD